jgi:hypothetical protein
LDAAPGSTADKKAALSLLGRQGLVVAGPELPLAHERKLGAWDFYARVVKALP